MELILIYLVIYFTALKEMQEVSDEGHSIFCNHIPCNTDTYYMECT